MTQDGKGERPWEDLKELALVNGDVYEAGWSVPGVPGSRVEFIRRFRAHGNFQVAVRLPGGVVSNQLFRASDVAQAFGSDDPDVHFW